MQITASLVKELRERTGAGMMECKKALVATEGDMEAAVEQMRKSGLAAADKKSSRVAAEGVVAIATGADKKSAAMVEVNCETDFVAKEGAFQDFVSAVADRILGDNPSDVQALNGLAISDSESTTVEERRLELVARIGENITVRRFVRLATEAGELGSYSHGGRIGVVVEATGGEGAATPIAEVARDVAMHVAASQPLCVSEADVPSELLEKERSILVAQAADSGKPPEIIEKMVAGRLKKYLSETTLMGQPFVKDPDLSVAKFLGQHKVGVATFQRFEVGEGIERKQENFADEVMAQVRGTDS